MGPSKKISISDVLSLTEENKRASLERMVSCELLK